MGAKWDLPFDAPERSDRLAAALARRDDLSPSQQGLLVAIRFWNVLFVLAVTLAFVLSGLSAIAVLLLVFLVDASPLAVVACVGVAAASLGANRLWQLGQEKLFARWLGAPVVADSSLSGVTPLALPAVRKGDEP